MKSKDLVKRLKNGGFRLLRHGGNHDVFSNGKITVAVPRSREINEYTALEILKKAEL